MHDRIAVVDFGGQYAHLIANKLRHLHILAEIKQPDDPVETFREYKGIVLSGSPATASKDDCVDQMIMDLDIPILGLCFGHQEMARHYGGTIAHTAKEYGPARFQSSSESILLRNVPKTITVWMSHGDSVVSIPDKFEEVGVSVDCDGTVHRNAAMACETLRRYGLQFHPEVDDTESGDVILTNFAIDICGCDPTWTASDFIDKQINEIQKTVGDRDVLLLVSGGVDSTVCAKLLGAALRPDQLHLLHIDNGLMRKDESSIVIEELEALGLDDSLHFVNASKKFFEATADLTDPEEKRKAIGDTFVRVFEREVKRLGLERAMLGQGTIYPDTIESGGTKRSNVIKTHHNRVGAIKNMIAEGRVVEPIRELYKAEVREVGELLGVAHHMLRRHPFPGPGLGVRCLCGDGTQPPVGRQALMQISIDAQLSGTKLKGMILPMRSVGVKGDQRSYEQPVVLWGGSPSPAMMQTASQIYSRIPGINRCLLDLTGEGVRTAIPLRASLTRERVNLLREIDDIVMKLLDEHGIIDTVWQCPVAIAPIEINGSGTELVIIRPVLSERAMTARPFVPSANFLDDARSKILSFQEVSGLTLDLTTKPPGCIEME